MSHFYCLGKGQLHLFVCLCIQNVEMFQIGIVLYFIFVAFLLILYAIVNRSNKSIESYKAKIKSLDDNKKINRTDITFEQRYGYDYDYIIGNRSHFLLILQISICILNSFQSLGGENEGKIITIST